MGTNQLPKGAGAAMDNVETVKRNVVNPAEMSLALLETLWQSGQLLTRFIDHHQHADNLGMGDKRAVLQAFAQLGQRMMADPFYAMRKQSHPWQDYLALWQATMLKMLGQEVEPVVTPKKSDKRFKHADWEKNFVFDYIKQSYLITSRYLHGIVVGVEGLDDETRRKVDFYTRQFIDALAPSNFALTNPQVLDETLRTGGTNLVNGLQNLLEDMERGEGKELRIKMTDTDAFKLGENLAVTKGKVVYQNELMQLIQYEASTPKVYERPLLIIPPWINKFYILDLRENNSFIKWAIDQGHTVFVISWVNPDAKLAHKDFEDYMLEGPLEALDAIRECTGEKTVNVIGYCLGGTLLAATLAYLATKKAKRVESATFFTAMIDFSEPGELGVFTDANSLSALEQRMERQGYLDAKDMAQTFNLLRSNDLIWNFVVNNYLLGKEPLPFDLLYWNADSTRMPAKMHSFYLRNMYRDNRLMIPGGITLNGVPVDISKVHIPTYFFAAVEDHIAPWKSTYAGTKHFSGQVRFVLGEAGHTAGVVNPPAAQKYGYWAGAELPDDAEQWLSNAKKHVGSWWEDWQRWIVPFAGKKIPRRIPGGGKLKPIEDAPGSYVKQRFDVVAR
jgi:polyhydroxyalkanoate synthase subunit PhaC